MGYMLNNLDLDLMQLDAAGESLTARVSRLVSPRAVNPKIYVTGLAQR